MGSVWKRLQRVNKRAAKFQFTVSYHQLVLEFSPKWQPHKLSLIWSRRSRRVHSAPLSWEPTLQNPYKGIVVWPVPENHQIAVTLFKDLRTNELENKEWKFIIEDVPAVGKRRQLGVAHVNMRKYASVEAAQSELQISFKPDTKKISMAKLDCTLSCVFLREGKATDEDMQSMASLMSVNNTSDDIAPLDDVEDEDVTQEFSLKTSINEVTQHLQQMTTSLSGSDYMSTPISVKSVQSLPLDDKTPTLNIAPPPIIIGSTPKTGVITTTKAALPFDQFLDCDIDPYSVECLEILDSLGVNDELESTSAPQKTESLFTYNSENTNTAQQVSDLNTTVVHVEQKSEAVCVPTKAARQTTPGQELLEWCQEMTLGYPGVKVTNLTTSWRNGMAFAALIHHFEPKLLDFNSLNSHDVKGNCKIAFDAGDKLGIPRVIEPTDMHMLAVPDKLAVMTYLHQLRAHFTGDQLEVQQIGKTAEESNYIVGKFNTDNDTDLTNQIFGQEISNLRKSKRLQHLRKLQEQQKDSLHQQQQQKKRLMDSEEETTKNTLKSNLHLDLKHTNRPEGSSNPNASVLKQSPTAANNNIQELILTNSLNLINKVLSEEDDRIGNEQSGNSSSGKKTSLMTRRELTDPFGSDEEDEECDPKVTNNNVCNMNGHLTISSSRKDNLTISENYQTKDVFADLPKPNAQILLRHSEQRERARQLLEHVKRDKVNSTSSAMSEEERQTQLRQRARKLLAEVRRSSTPTQDSICVNNVAATHFIASSAPDETSIQNGIHLESNGRIQSVVCVQQSDEKTEKSSLPPNTERFTPDKLPDELGLKQMGIDVHNLIDKEMEDLEREQGAIDEQAATLEKQLRLAMESSHNVEEEEALMAKWFMFVNKKNALLRRQMQLNILEKEADLETRYKMLNEELQQIASIDDWKKSEEQRNREQMLLDELVQIVNKRDELVHHLDNQEKAIEEDDLIEKDLSHLDLQPKDKCVVQ